MSRLRSTLMDGGNTRHPGSAPSDAQVAPTGSSPSHCLPAGSASTAPTESRETAGILLPTADELAARLGIARNTANGRLRRYRLGKIGMDMLLAPPRAKTLYDPSLPTPEEIVATVGITRDAATARLRRCMRGEIPPERLLESKDEALERMYHQYSARSSDPDWGNLGLGPRRNIEHVPGPTALELREFGRGNDETEGAWQASRRYNTSR